MIRNWNDYDKGVEVKAAGHDEATVTYTGLLVKSGADSIYLHYGYGSPHSWQNVSTCKMEKSGYGYEKSIKTPPYDAVNICFKDSAANWDNNAGHNWIVH